jgi:hypothetical protein
MGILLIHDGHSRGRKVQTGMPRRLTGTPNLRRKYTGIGFLFIDLTECWTARWMESSSTDWGQRTRRARSETSEDGLPHGEIKKRLSEYDSEKDDQRGAIAQHVAKDDVLGSCPRRFHPDIETAERDVQEEEYPEGENPRRA